MIITLKSRLLALLLCIVALPASAQTWPEKPVRLVVPFAPGGGTDIAARLIAERLSERLGKTVVVENRPGANGAIAGELVARAAPDGYTFLVATTSGHAFAPALGVKLPYDPIADFAPVALFGTFPTVLVVHPGVRAATIAEFIALALAEPGKLNYGSAGNGSTNHMVMELIAQARGLQMVHVPYRGAGPAGQDLLAGQIQAMVDSVAAALPNIEAGKLRALAVSTDHRQPTLANVPTLREAGIDVVYAGWTAIVAPARTPEAVIARLNREVGAALADPKVRERYVQLGIEPATMPADALGRFMVADKERWTEVVRRAGIKPD
jgi:tripartite-type tricarboxylate transporter receptor subunit TctC